MIFGRIPLEAAEGAILAHGVTLADETFKKGRVLSADDLERLRRHGAQSVFAARFEAGDVGEDQAAFQLAEAAKGAHIVLADAFTGRANLYSDAHGLLVYDRARLAAVNRTDEAISLAALEPFAHVHARSMIATVKIVPFSVPAPRLETAVATAKRGGALFSVAPFRRKRAGLIVTEIAGVKAKLTDKAAALVRSRLEALGGELGETAVVPHEEEAIAAALAAQRKSGLSPLLVLAASAIVDRRDVIPAAIERAGGVVERFGMPVDPGNLLLLGAIGDTPAVGLPGCARSPKLNGFDWVLERLMADLPVTAEDIAEMGAGGLLKETGARPQPREETQGRVRGSPSARGGKTAMAKRLGVIILAAGASRRMGALNKLLAPVSGKPLVAHIADAALAFSARPVVVVTGHEASKVKAALAGRDVAFAHNPDFERGLSGSLRAGLDALPDGLDGVFICLGDMPRIAPRHLETLASRFDPEEGRSICLPVFRGKRGNPVLWSSAYFAEMRTVEGDVGARHLIGEHGDEVCEVPFEDDAVLNDIDTPDDLSRLE